LTRISIALILTFAALPIHVAASDASALPAKPKVKTILRVDPKTGKLVRSSFVVAERAAVARAAAPPQVVTPQVVKPQVIEPIPLEPRSISASGLVAPVPQRPQPRIAKMSAPPERIREIVEQKSRQHGLDPLLVHSVIRAESNYNPYAISPKGAEGLMQLIPSTARQYGVSNAFDPEQNIEGGIRYLKYLQTLFSDERLVLAAYNAGEGAVAKTQDYVYKVGRYYGLARREQPPTPALIAPLSKTVPPPPVLQEFVDGEGRIHITLRQVIE
jgi:soluble lytic murein transglycosylase-like protein